MEQAFQRARGRGIDVRQQTDGGVHGLGAPQRLPIRQRARPSLCEESLRGTSERNLLRREGERPRAPAPPPGYGLSGRPGQARRRGSGRRMIRCTAKLTSAIRLYDPTLWTVAGQVWVDGGRIGPGWWQGPARGAHRTAASAAAPSARSPPRARRAPRAAGAAHGGIIDISTCTIIPLLDYYGQVRSSAHKKAPTSTMHPGAGGL